MSNPLATHLAKAGWNDAGRDCWIKALHAAEGPALVLRWASSLTQDDCNRLLRSTTELTAALVAARNSAAKQGNLFEEQQP